MIKIYGSGERSNRYGCKGKLYYKQVMWVCEQFRAMGASEEEIDLEYEKMMDDPSYQYYCLDLLDFKPSYLS